MSMVDTRNPFKLVWRWFVAHWKEFDLFFDYWPAVADRFNSIVWGTGILSFFLFTVWLSLATPPMRLLIMGFFGALLLAGYYTWRADRLRLIPRLQLKFCRHWLPMTSDP